MLGSPRSGTSMTGAFLGSASSICYLGEYGGFHLTHSLAPRLFVRIPAKEKERYLYSIQQHAEVFAAAVAEEAGASFYCDSTPWNLLIVDELFASHPDISAHALFVICLRDYRGVIQSLERSYNNGFRWAGSTVAERAVLWANFYSNAHRLPADRTAVFSYDRLCEEPQAELDRLRDRLDEIGAPIHDLNEEVFAATHATQPDENRPTIANLTDGTVTFRSMPTFDPDRWTATEQEEAEPHVSAVDRDLETLFGERYRPDRERDGV